jgi:hypothetical protein
MGHSSEEKAHKIQGTNVHGNTPQIFAISCTRRPLFGQISTNFRKQKGSRFSPCIRREGFAPSSPDARKKRTKGQTSGEAAPRLRSPAYNPAKTPVEKTGGSSEKLPRDFAASRSANAGNIDADLVDAGARGDVEGLVVVITEAEIGHQLRTRNGSQMPGVRRENPDSSRA